MHKIEVTELFPTPFMRVRGLLNGAQVAALARELSHSRMEANAKSEGLSHTAVVSADDSEPYRELGAAIQPRLVDFGQLLFGEKLSWTIKEMWMSCLSHGGQQALHSHANSFISGIVYLSESHRSARTIFYRGLGGRDFAFSNDHPGSQPGPFNSVKWAVPEIAPGDMVLFPSYLLHEVPKNEGQERITLAFNAIPERLRSWGYEIRFSHARS